MLEGLFVTPAATAIAEALASAGVTTAGGPIAVVGNARLAAALAEGRDVLPVGMPPRAAKKLARHLADTSSLTPGSLAAVVGVDVATLAAWEDTLRAWVRVVRDGGAIVFVDRGHAQEASRRALCAGLCELEQRRAGRAVITSGLVTHLDPAGIPAG
ncbi:MAG TPA: hypothetical protein VNO30_37075 [Kofleriaceae bacterium]|nr:hypothetical protein [Kofleriaceae bacterium]